MAQMLTNLKQQRKDFKLRVESLLIGKSKSLDAGPATYDSPFCISPSACLASVSSSQPLTESKVDGQVRFDIKTKDTLHEDLSITISTCLPPLQPDRLHFLEAILKSRPTLPHLIRSLPQGQSFGLARVHRLKGRRG